MSGKYIYEHLYLGIVVADSIWNIYSVNVVPVQPVLLDFYVRETISGNY